MQKPVPVYDRIDLKQKTLAQTVKTVALSLLNLPYKGGTLCASEPEQLVARLDAFDCMTFVETVLAAALTVWHEGADQQTFLKNLTLIRYKDGRIKGYESRLHYTASWLDDNVKKDVFKDITAHIGGIPRHLSVHFMSAHPDLYPALKTDPLLIEKMTAVETQLNQKTSFILPTAQIDAYEKNIKDGDIVCFATNAPGLDFAHVGIALRQQGQLTFIHASSQAGKIIIHPGTLAQYCQSLKNIIGIAVARLA